MKLQIVLILLALPAAADEGLSLAPPGGSAEKPGHGVTLHGPVVSTGVPPGWDYRNLNRFALQVVGMGAALSVETLEEPGGARFRIRPPGPGGASALKGISDKDWRWRAYEEGWTSAVAIEDDTLVWTVTGATPEDERRIRQAGFYGLIGVVPPGAALQAGSTLHD